MTREYVDLHALGIALINIQAIFDRSYCFYTGHKRITANDRENFKIVAYNVKRGSIIFDAGLTAFTLQQSLAITQTIDPKLIFKATVAGFKFLHKYFSQTNKNNVPTVNITNSPGAVFNYNSDNNTITVSNDTMHISQAMRPALRRVATVFGQQAGELSINSQEYPKEDIVLNNEDAHLFKSNKVISNVPIILNGIVRSFSVENLTGHFEVSSSPAIPAGKYAFVIKDANDYNIDWIIESLKGNSIQVTAYIEYDVTPTIQSNITKLYLSAATLVERLRKEGV
ncbi:hypothetical protein SAMN02910356_00191 [Selenomonas sp. GACV-9]|nr:hypothetical protein SAMN02910356_00191 [Selenomonas ruminantium]